MVRRALAGHLALSCAGALLVATPARAEPKAPAKAGAQQSAPLSIRRDAAGGAEAVAARGRARAGDCAGALASFDAAIRGTVEPTLRRDRGLCHEKLGHPYPAIEDFRAYLTAAPDAPDAEQIRERLKALEQRAEGSGGSSDADESGASAEASASVGASASVEASASSSPSAEDLPKANDPSKSYDEFAAAEKHAEDADRSPLRYGSGFVIGPFLHMPRFYVGDGARDELGYGVGGAFRYSTGPTVTILTEIGYGGVGTSGAASSQSGPLLLGGVELRLPVSRFASDHILIRGGLGYERYVVSGTRAVDDRVLGRFGLGFRHVFGPAIGLELLVDGGPAYIMPEIGEGRLNGVISGSVAFVVGF